MIYATANIGVPNTIVNVAMPFKQRQHPNMSTVDYDLVSDSGERVAAQAVKVARYGDGSIQVAHLYGKFKTPASKITVEERKTPPKAFVFTPFTETKYLSITRGRSNVQLLFYGPVVKRVEVRGVSDGGVPFVKWFTFFIGEDAIRVDSVYHNGFPLACEDIITINLTSTIDATEVPVVVPEPVPISGYFPQRARRIIHSVLMPNNGTPTAVAHDVGWGVVDEWRKTNAYTSLQLRVPDFGSINLIGKENNELSKALQAIQNGTPYIGNYGRLGLSLPLYPPEGGMTGGTDIDQSANIVLAATGNVNGLRLAYIKRRMVTDRHNTALIDPDGTFATLEKYENIPGWQIAADDARFEKTNSGYMDGPWGFSSQPTIDPLQAPEKTILDTFEPIDWAHLIRAHRDNIALAWLANDPVAKWLIQQDAELARMSWFKDRLANDSMMSYANPGKGLHYSRIHGWMSRIIAECYALSSDRLRQRYATNMYEVLEVANRAETPTGLVNCDSNGKEYTKPPYNKTYGVTVCIQHGLFTGGYFALCRALDSYLGITPMEGIRYLLQGQNTIWSAAIRLKDPKSPIFLTRQLDASGLPLDSNHPTYPDGKPTTGNVDSEQIRSIIGLCGHYALDVGDQALLGDAVAMSHKMLGQNPVAALLAMGNSVTDSDAILLSFWHRYQNP